MTSPVSPTPLHKRLKDALVSAFRAKERLPFSAQHAPHVELFCHDTCVSTEHGPFLGPNFNTGPNTGPNLGNPKRDHNFDNPPLDDSRPTQKVCKCYYPNFKELAS